MPTDKPSVIVIGAGFTGCAIAYDLGQRGFKVTVLERGEIASGTSGRTHGLLHSGARYCVTDQEAATECIQENIILRKIAKQCIEFNGGLFIALNDIDAEYVIDFEKGLISCGIPYNQLNPHEALRVEPALNRILRTAFSVPDGVFDPLRLALAFAASALQYDVDFLTFHDVTDFIIDGLGNVCGVKATNRHTGKEEIFNADLIINATGAWAGILSKFAGIKVAVQPTPGIMVAYDARPTQQVINRLCEPDDGDIIIPQRRMAVIGTTSFEIDDVDYIPVEKDQIELMQRMAALLIPSLSNTKIRGVYMSARPLISGVMSGRSLSRTFKCYDHKSSDGIDGFITITGGKATTCRVMAEKTVDLVCEKLGVHAVCQTAQHELIDYHNYYRTSLHD
jgi:glycerol-3-phosphate dehydrogenase